MKGTNGRPSLALTISSSKYFESCAETPKEKNPHASDCPSTTAQNVRERYVACRSQHRSMLRSISASPETYPASQLRSGKGIILTLRMSRRAIVIVVLEEELVSPPQIGRYAARLLINAFAKFVCFVLRRESGFRLLVSSCHPSEDISKRWKRHVQFTLSWLVTRKSTILYSGLETKILTVSNQLLRGRV